LSTAPGARSEWIEPGKALLTEGQSTDRLYVLIDGGLGLSRGEVYIGSINEPGSIFGEMSLFVDAPHAFTVTAQSAVHVHILDDAHSFFRSNPDVAFLIARLLAYRLNAASGYLVDLKQQFAGHDTHLAMVGDVLESLICQQYEEVRPGSDREPGAWP
jgi:CRP-like cAMP-binding protein